MISLGFTKAGLYAFASEIDAVARRGDALRPAMDLVATRMLAHEKLLFDTSGSSVGHTWKATESGNKPLIGSTHRLMDSLTVRGAPDQILQITDSSVTFGTDVPYAHFHDEGESVPQRRPIMFTRKDANDYYKIVQNYVFEGVLPHG